MGDGLAEGMQLDQRAVRGAAGPRPGRAAELRARHSAGTWARSAHGRRPALADRRRAGHGARRRRRVSAAEDRDGWLDWLLAERVQPQLGVERPAILYDYPASQAALARVRPGDPPVAERFELYVSGIELANGYHELLDAGELRRRNAAVNARRQADGKLRCPSRAGCWRRWRPACRRRSAWPWASTAW